jgi:hypothetical protein
MPLCEATQYQLQHSELFWSTPAQKICEWIKNEEEFKNLGKNNTVHKHISQWADLESEVKTWIR